jgi:hypothetical protein
MRIHRDSLLRIAKETSSQRTFADKTIIAVYLTGSLLTENPFMGGTTDIDLVFVHSGMPNTRREVIPLSPEIHLDIKHNPHSEYENTRELRVNPWLGPELWAPQLLYEKEHFFEFVQAGVRDKFHEKINVLARAQLNMSHARQVWSGIKIDTAGGFVHLMAFLKSLNHAVNAIAILNGAVLAERRYLLQFPARAEAAGKSVLYDQLIVLLGGNLVDAESMTTHLSNWEKTFVEAGSRTNADARLHPARLNYYKSAMKVLLESGNLAAPLWPLLYTGTLAASVLPKSRLKAWESTIKQLGLSLDTFQGRLEALDQFLDGIEILLEDMASADGIDTTYQNGRKVD